MATRPIARVFSLSPTPQTRLPVRPICRCFSSTPVSLKIKSKKEKAAALKLKQKRKRNPYYKLYDLKEMEQYTLCDAIRYIKAFEIHKAADASKYEVHVKLKAKRSGPVIRPNQLKLPYPVKTDVKFAVICAPDSKQAKEARDAGAIMVGEEELFEAIKNGRIEFDRLIAHPNSMPKLQKEGLPRILGPKGLMPNVKNGTISTDPASLLNQLVGGALYRERLGVVRMAIGKLTFTPEMLRDNLRAFLARIKSDARQLPEEAAKEINEVVLSSTRSPGFSLNGMFRSPLSPPTSALSVH